MNNFIFLSMHNIKIDLTKKVPVFTSTFYILSGSEKENFAFKEKECLSIQCPENAKIFIEQECSLPYALICNKTCKKSLYRIHVYLYGGDKILHYILLNFKDLISEHCFINDVYNSFIKNISSLINLLIDYVYSNGFF